MPASKRNATRGSRDHPVGSTHQAVLGLQLDLQCVDRASQVNDVRLVALQLLGARGHLLVKFLHLQWGEIEEGQVYLPGDPREAGPPARGPPAC